MRKPLDLVYSFFQNENGAVAVDWTVLAAATVGLGLSAAVAVRNGALNLGGDISTSLSAASETMLGSLGSVPFVFSPIYYTQDQIDSFLVRYDSDSYTIENMEHSFGFYSQRAADYMAAGDYDRARIAIDAVYVYEQTLYAKGGELPDGFDNHQTLYELYDARPA